ncbi:MAG: [protein-PII] uridylyltransferase [Pseudohaliea sp.]
MAPLPEPLFDADDFRSRAAEHGLVAAGRSMLAECNAALDAAFTAGEPAGALIRGRALVIDGLLSELWSRVDWGPAPLALVAVGGYGRGELHPHSDIDLLVLHGDGAAVPEVAVERFVTLLWDLGLSLGHSVRSVDECTRRARDDITILTNLLEARLLAGDGALLAELRERTSTGHMWSARAFLEAKREEQESRHEKFADTEYNLEPNVKSSPGGLRDLQLIGWLARRHFGWSSVEELAENGLLTEEEAQILLRGREFLWQVRYALHLLAGREEDRLLFDHQRALARQWGFTDDEKLAVEKFMQVYYRWALAIAQLNELLLQTFDQAILGTDSEDEVETINDSFEIRNGYIAARRPDLFSERPGALLEVFLLAGSNPAVKGIAAPTIRLIREHRHLVDDDFRADPANKALFLDILRCPHRMTRQLRRMSRYGILGKYLPAFGRIVGQMQHDLFHTYTVDAHTLQVVENMRRFLRPESDERFPVTGRVARRLPKLELLYIAGLYHDIGKGRGGDHSELGAVDAEVFCRDHGLSRRDTELVSWLVRNHLLMSAVSQRKDISDPDVIQQFARHVGTQERLDYLFTLTVADITGTNPTLWNAWRGSLLRQLYAETKRALRRGLENPIDKNEWIKETRRAAMELLEYRGFTEDELDTLWEQRGEDYFLRERAEDIAWHTEAIAGHHDREQPLVLVRNTVESSVANTTQIFIHARSDKGTFPRICAELEQLDLSVHDARVYNGSDGMSLDTFYVLDSSGAPLDEEAGRLKHIGEHLSRALADEARGVAIVQRHMPRQMRSFTLPTETSMSTDEAKGVTVLEVMSPDRPGLLARIGEVFVRYGVVLQAAKIQTLGERVEDVFFITDNAQRPLTDPARCRDIQDAICRELDGQQAA